VALNTAGVATLTPSPTLSVGTHTVSVVFNNPPDYSSGSATLTPDQVITKDDTNVVITSSANPSVYGQNVTITATVVAKAPGAGIPTGNLTFTVDGVVQPAQALDSNGQATYTFTNPSVNLHLVRASYAGDGNFNASATVNDYVQTVDKAD